MSTIKVKSNPKIITKDAAKKENGFLVPIFNVHEKFVAPEQHPQQVYLTVAKKGTVKGPHLHMKRWGLLTCVRGNAKVVVKIGERYEEYFTGEDYNFQTIQVPAGTPSALVNIGEVDCYILNMPSPAWHADNQDDWDVEFENYKF